MGAVSALTDVQRADRALTELDFQRMIVGTKPPGLAVIYGWDHVHFRQAQTKAGWRLPASGSMAAGWPDLTLVRTRDRRLIFAELKRETEQLRPDQERVLEVLRSLDVPLGRTPQPFDVPPRVEVHVWRPSDLTSGAIAAVLR